MEKKNDYLIGYTNLRKKVQHFCTMSTDALIQICSNYIQIDKPKIAVGFALLDPLYPIPRPRLSTSNWDTVNMILNLDKLFCDNQLSIRVSVTGKAFYGIMLLRSRLDTS